MPPKPAQPLSLSITEQLAYSTVRIECEQGNGKKATGTGFFFSFLERENGNNIPAIVTNKHVVRSAMRGRFRITRRGSDGIPIDNSHIDVPLSDFESRWIMHPEENVDLCIMPMAPILKWFAQNNETPFYTHINAGTLPSSEEVEEFTAMEDIVMIGYPNGIWDSVNNQPIFRKEITATHPAKNLMGKAEFMIDAACFPGSSGSPVFLLNLGSYTTRQGGVKIGASPIKLLGILYAGPQFTVTGDVRVVDIPTVQQTISVATIPNNLGYVIKAQKLLDFNPLLERLSNPA